jgi:hypothetical protein
MEKIPGFINLHGAGVFSGWRAGLVIISFWVEV